MTWECRENAGKTLGMVPSPKSPLKGEIYPIFCHKKRQVYFRGWSFPHPKGFQVVVAHIFYFHPYLGKWSYLTNIFQTGWNHQLGFPTIFSMIMACKLRDFSRTPQGLHQRNHHHREFGAFRDRNRMVSSGTTRIQCTLDCIVKVNAHLGGGVKYCFPKDPDMSKEWDFPYNPILGMGFRPSILL